MKDFAKPAKGRGRLRNLALLVALGASACTDNPGRSLTDAAPPQLAIAPGSPQFGHVFTITLENTGYSSVIGSSSMPYLNSLATQYGLATQYYANTHPSIGNYFMLATGQIITNNDSYSTVVNVDNVVRELLAAGKTWKSYAEDLPSVGYTGPDVGLYARKHNIFALLSDVVNTSQVNNLVPFTQFATDLRNGTLPSFSNIVPNLCNDAHDCGLGTADSWLQNNIAPLIASATFQRDGLLIITFDEASTSDATHGGGRVVWIAVSPLSKRGYQSTTLYQHPSTLRLILEGLGVSALPGAAASAPAMWEFFGSAPPPPPPTVASVTVSPATASVAVGASTQLSATAKDSAGNVLSGQTFTWTTSNGAVATVSSSGLVQGVAAGSATITATDAGKSGSAAVTVTASGPPPPPPPCLTNGNSWVNQAFATQTGTFTATYDVTPSTGAVDGVTGLSPASATDYSSLAAIVRFNTSGTIDARNGGAYTAAATIGYSANATYHVRLVVNVPARTYSAYVTPAGGTEQAVGVNYAFRTDQASATSLGFFSARTSSGSLNLCTFALGGGSPPPPPPPPPPTVASVTVSPSSASLLVGGTQQLTATAKDSAGNTLSGQTFTWTTSAGAVATVSAGGLVSGVAAGSATITAGTGGKSGTSAITVALVPVASVTVSPASGTLTVGATQQLTATTKDAAGNILTGRTVTWTSGATAVATVSSSGLVTAIGAGSATITATSEGKSGMASFTVTAPPPPPPPPQCLTSGNSWINQAFATQTGTFTATYDVTPSTGAVDGVTGLGPAGATDYSSLAAIVRFNTSGTIDARNGGAYTAAASIRYSAGATYHVRIVVNVPGRTYSAYVTPAGGTEQAIGLNYAFRTDQAAATSLADLGARTSTGSLSICGLRLQ